MNSLSFLSEVIKEPKPVPEVEPRRCLRNRLHSCTCDLCIESCPQNALQYVDKQILLDKNCCTGCMRCTAVCPSEVFSCDDGLGKILSYPDGSTQKSITFSCPHQRLFLPEETIVPCLGIFSLEALLFLSHTRKTTTFYFNTAGCQACSNYKASLAFKDELQQLQNVGPSLSTRFKIQENNTHDHEVVDRRSFLRTLTNTTLETAKASLQPTQIKEKRTPGSRTIPSRIVLLKKCFEDTLDETWNAIAGKLQPQLTIAESCTPCNRCSAICPTGAIRLEKEKNSKHVVFRGENCSSCGLCINFCKQKALSLSCNYQAQGSSLAAAESRHALAGN